MGVLRAEGCRDALSPSAINRLPLALRDGRSVGKNAEAILTIKWAEHLYQPVARSSKSLRSFFAQHIYTCTYIYFRLPFLC